MTSNPELSLRESLVYEPQVLRFGTSGRRGELIHLTQLEIYINALAELRYLQTLPAAEGGIQPGDSFYYAYDLRPSSTALSGDPARGGLCQAIVQAIRDAGMQPVNLGAIPTPALTYFALQQGKGSIMVTGSHIPFDRNGYKLNTSRGELLKVHEGPIGKAVEAVRASLYSSPAAGSIFNSTGMLVDAAAPLPAETADGIEAYHDRYVSFFAGTPLAGLRLLVYQHSAVGRDFLVKLLSDLGAEVVTAGRSETFVPIDTENIEAPLLASLQEMTNDATAKHGHFDAVVSTDGDSDRPLVLGVDPASGKLRFFGGDLLGMVVAAYLGADAVVVPISCNDAIDRGSLRSALRPKTKIGSPFVIDGMELAAAGGANCVCGWEANGGFLLGSDLVRDGRTLRKLATRDAILPIVSVLCAARAAGSSLLELFDQLPKRFSRAALLKQFPRPVSIKIMERFGPSNPGAPQELQGCFPQELSLPPVVSMDYTDGVRATLENGEVVHIRPSGNADELRIYAVADSQTRADAICNAGVAEPNGLLRRLEAFVTQ